jgi:hypothetical protein
MLDPSSPCCVNTAFALLQPDFMVHIEDEVREGVGVIHPTHHEDNVGMVIRDTEGVGLNNGMEEIRMAKARIRLVVVCTSAYSSFPGVTFPSRRAHIAKRRQRKFWA